MVKWIRLWAILNLALFSLILWPAVAFAGEKWDGRVLQATNVVSPQSRTSTDTKTLYLVFASTVTQGLNANKEVDDAGLTLHVKKDGSFKGTLVFAFDGSSTPLVGKVSADGHINLSVSLANGTSLQGKGKRTPAQDFVGTYKLLDKNGKQILAGLWSAFVLASPQTTLALGFEGQITKGPDKSKLYGGALALDQKTLKGIMELQDGTRLQANAQLSHNNIALTFTFPKGSKIFAVGNPFIQGKVHGYQGAFLGPGKGDIGGWDAEVIVFAA